MNTFSCPGCNSKLRRSPGIQTGATVQCPRCSRQFAVPAEDAAAPESAAEREENFASTPRPRRDDRVEREDRGDDEDVWSRRDDDGDFRSRLSRRSRGPLSSKYSVDFNGWWNEAGKHYSAFLGPMIGFVFLMFLLSLLTLIPILGPLLNLLVVLPLSYGPWAVALRQIRGQRWTFGDFWCGFNWMGPIIGYNLLLGLVALGCMLCLGVSALILVAMSPSGPGGLPSGIVTGVLGTGGVLSVVSMIYFGIRFGTFGPLLIVDRSYGPIEAMRGSWQMTQGKVLSLFLVHFMLGGLILASLLLCGIGVLLAAPMLYLVWTAGYLRATTPARDSAFE